MKALILAAGLGSRLSPITDTCPKALVPVNGKPIIMKQIDNLYENNIFDITVIAGYKAEVLIKAIEEYAPGVKIIVNEDYNDTNNMYSAYIGRTYMGEDGFLMMNADVFFDASVIKSLISFEMPNAIVTDIGNYIEESMKVIEENGRIVHISKQISEKEALGSSIDVYKFSKEAGDAFFNMCKYYIEDIKELKKWSEVALDAILKDVEFKACNLDGRWFEIDNHEDLRIAEQIFGNDEL